MLTVALVFCLGFTAASALAMDEAAIPSVEIAAPPMPEINHPSGSGHEIEATGEGNIGFPQLDPSSYPSQIFWLAIAFILLYTLMSKMALPKIEAVLENRRNQREGNLNQAEEFRAEAEKIRTAYEDQLAKAQDEAQKVLMEMEGDIKEISMARSTAFAENARKRIALSEDVISKAKDAAMASIPDIAADIAVEASGKVASLTVNRADARKTVQSVMMKEAV